MPGFYENKSQNDDSTVDRCIEGVKESLAKFERELKKYLAKRPKYLPAHMDTKKSDLATAIDGQRSRLNTLSKIKNNEEISSSEYGELLSLDSIREDHPDIVNYPRVKVAYTYECTML